jgi:GMP synthase-like glutamine amidotransferase
MRLDHGETNLKRQIVVIDPAVKIPETDCFNQIVAQSPLQVTYHLPKFNGMDSLRNLPHPPAGILILGSASSVNDQEPWQVEMNTWLKPYLLQGIPTLGLCYGHQLIASLFGAKVGFHFPDQKKLSGFREVSFDADSLWSKTMVRGPLVVSHKETVKECPTGFKIIGRSPEVAIDGLKHTTLPLWSFQSHPEATPSFVQRQGILVPPDWSILNFGRGMIEGFLRFVESHSTSGI